MQEFLCYNIEQFMGDYMALTQKEKELLELLNQSENGYTFNELICKLSSRKDYLNKYLNHLKLAGYNPIKRYYSDGRTRIYFPPTVGSLNVESNRKSVPIVTFSHETELKALVISDLHLGCAAAMPEVFDEVYEYATANGIHIIFGCGDLLDGEAERGAAAGPLNGRRLCLQEQIDLLLKTLGDHEKYSSRVNVVDVARAINTARNDLIIGEQDELKVSIRNEVVRLNHIKPKTDQEEKRINRINIFGHSHRYESRIICPQLRPLERCLMITAPTLSNLKKCGGVVFPSILELDIYFNKMYIDSTVVKELKLRKDTGKFELVTESAYMFPKKNTENVSMHDVEYYRPEHTKKLTKK